MDYLHETTQLLYSQLLGQCLNVAAPSGRGLSFVTKIIKGSTQWYLQLTVGSHKSQHYIGPDTLEVLTLISKEKKLWESAKPDRQARELLVSMLVSGGAHTVSAAEARLFEVLERTGIFLVGGVLVSSHAFAIYGNMLGITWPNKVMQTRKFETAREEHIILGLRSEPVDVNRALLNTNMGIVDVPVLDRKRPSTHFNIRGKQFSVDIVTPMIGKSASKPIHMTALNSYGKPIQYIDYLLDDIQPAVIVARAGIVINVPSPARYALYQLAVSAARLPAPQPKATKDIAQTNVLLNVLLEDRPGDLRLAINAAKKIPAKFLGQIKSGLKKLPKELESKLNRMLK